MRVIVVDHDSTMLETTVRALRPDFVIDAVTNKADCIDLLRQNDFDLVVACERLADGSGLELLGQIAKRWPATLRVFAADRERLRLLQGRLGPFELFQALAYPINPQKLLATLALAQEAHAAHADTTTIQHIVLGGDGPGDAPSEATPEPAPPPPPPRPTKSSSAASPAKKSAAPSPPKPVNAPRPQNPPARVMRSRAEPTPDANQIPPSRASSDSRAPVGSAPTAAASSRPSSARPWSGRTLAGRALPGRAPLEGTAPNDSLAEASSIAAAAARARAASDRTPTHRKAFITGAGCAVALCAIVVALAEFGSGPTLTPTPPPLVPPQPVFSKEVSDQVAQVEADFEQDDLQRARTDVRKLQAMAPDHPRLQFFMSLLDRDMKPLGAATRPPSESTGSSRSGSQRKWVASAGSSTMQTPAAPVSAAGRPTAPGSDGVARPALGTTFAGRTIEDSTTAPSGVTSGAARDTTTIGGATTSTARDTTGPSGATTGTARDATGPSGATAATARDTTGPSDATAATARDTTLPVAATAQAANLAAAPTSGTAGAAGPASGAGATGSPSLSGGAPASTDTVRDADTTAPSKATDEPAAAPREPPPSGASSAATAKSAVPTVTADAQLTRRVAPEYPDSALRKGIEGYVDVQFTITAQGTVRDVAVVSSDPAEVFNRAATDAVRRWRYDPRVIDGQPVDTQSQVRLQFKLNGSLSH
jgi:TonB family protein